MRTLRTLFDFYLDASIHVGLAVSALIFVTSLLLNIPIQYALLGFAFFSTIVCYNFIKYGVEAKKYLIVSKTYHKRIQLFSFLSFFPAVWYAVQLNETVWMTVFGLSLLSLLYAIPFFPGTRNLRNFAGYKIYVVCLVWAGFTVLLPVFQAGVPVEWDVVILVIQRFLLVLVLMLPFEIRDMETDFEELRTIPQIIGVQRTVVLGIVLTLLFVLLTFFKDYVIHKEIVSSILLGGILIPMLLVSKKKQSKYFAAFWIESIPILWVLILVILRELG
ncbi:hypothetical protein [Flagellimonas sp.]|uniref:hypothetical protein n=1 Tax=Flagellimonas sp. TaxID=2058762 RepID=UPI003F49C454